MRYKPNFSNQLEGFDFKTIENSSQSIFALSNDLKLIYFNKAYINFAIENSTDLNTAKISPLGIELKNIVPEILLEFYTKNYLEALKTGEVWHHQYECSSDNNYRLFVQTVYPLKNKTGLLIENKLRIEKSFSEIDKKDNDPNLNIYTQPTGFINQCSNCRGIQRVDNTDKWDWVSYWVKNIPKNTSHTICPVCFDYYWKYGIK